MTVPEMAYRVSQQLQKRKEKLFDLNKVPGTDFQTATKKVLEVTDIDSTGLSRLKVFNHTVDFQAPINWHLDVSSGKEFPKTFAKDIDIRTDRYGSAKHVWEVNRMQFLPSLCYRYLRSGQQEDLEKFMQINRSWYDANPYLVGVNWYSNIEVNLRLINWFFCWELLDANRLMEENESFKAFVEQVWMPLIYLHCLYSYQNPSKFSSANNHLVSEGAGLFIATSLWNFKESKRWNNYAKKLLEEEIIKQHSENGVNLEEAAEYIQFITDFFLLSWVVAERTNNSFSAEYKNTLQHILQYIYDLMNFKGVVPYYGDEDDGRTVILEDQKDFNNFKSLLTSATVIFQNGAFKSKSNGWDLKNQVLFGNQGKQLYQDIANDDSPASSVFYQKEGHFICKKPRVNGEIYLHFDAAPLGFLSIAAHGHADALSIYLEVDGQPFLVDSGTFTYHTHFEKRKYFMGTLSHNTIRVDQQDQALICGPTLWRDHYKTEILAEESGAERDVIKAQHDGYSNIGVLHQRELHFDKLSDNIRLTDHLEISDSAQHLFEMPFHVHPSINIEGMGDNNYLLTAPSGQQVQLKLDQKVEVELVEGREEPFLGWYSHGFQNLEPCPVIYGKFNSNKSISVTAEIIIK